MFAKTIIDSDAFIDMPTSARLLYYDLGMRADDDGFVNSPRKIMRMIGASEDDMRVLISKNFILPFDSGVVVIKHWLIHNYIRKDRYTETRYVTEKSTLCLDSNGAYALDDSAAVDIPCIPSSGQPTVNQRSTNGQPMVNQRSTQVRIGKDRLGKDSIEKENIKEKKKIRHQYGEYKNVLLTDSDMEKLKKEFPNDYKDRIENLSIYIASHGKSYKNHLATIRNWARKDQTKPQTSNLVKINGEEYEYKNGKYYALDGSGVAVDPYKEDDWPF